jgi:NTE family protein
MLTSDLVLEGGGVKGAGLAGAVTALGKRYDFHRVAGTSAGAIVASLVAAGLGDRLEELTVETDFRSFLDPGPCGSWFGIVGAGLDVLLSEGLHRGEVLHRWIRDQLAGQGVHTWGDLRLPGTDARTPVEKRYGLMVIVSDVSRGRMLRLPWDYERLLGRDPDLMPVADAVRASASIPFFFRPWRMPVSPELADGRSDVVLTDGGMLSNYPIGLFDDEPERPTIGVKLSARLPLSDAPWADVDDPLTLARALVSTMVNAHDQIYVDQASVASRTVFVDSTGVSATDFGISEIEKWDLFQRGRASAEKFLSGWCFDRWRAAYAVAS